MDVYHKVLVQLFEETGGSDSKAINFVDLVKRMKFHANYPSIFKELSVQGWIVETGKADWVRLTHWGIEEAKKSQAGESGSDQEVKREVNRLLAEARELVGLLDILTADISRDGFSSIEKKISQINSLVNELKSKF